MVDKTNEPKQLSLLDLIDKIDNTDQRKKEINSLITEIANNAIDELSKYIFDIDDQVKSFINSKLETLVLTGLGLQKDNYSSSRSTYTFIGTNGFQSRLKEFVAIKARNAFQDAIEAQREKLVDQVMNIISKKEFISELEKTYVEAYNGELYGLYKNSSWKSSDRIEKKLSNLSEEISLRVKHMTLAQLQSLVEKNSKNG